MTWSLSPPTDWIPVPVQSWNWDPLVLNHESQDVLNYQSDVTHVSTCCHWRDGATGKWSFAPRMSENIPTGGGIPAIWRVLKKTVKPAAIIVSVSIKQTSVATFWCMNYFCRVKFEQKAAFCLRKISDFDKAAVAIATVGLHCKTEEPKILNGDIRKLIDLKTLSDVNKTSRLVCFFFFVEFLDEVKNCQRKQSWQNQRFSLYFNEAKMFKHFRNWKLWNDKKSWMFW